MDYKKMIAYIEKWGGVGHGIPYEHVSITFANEKAAEILNTKKSNYSGAQSRPAYCELLYYCIILNTTRIIKNKTQPPEPLI